MNKVTCKDGDAFVYTLEKIKDDDVSIENVDLYTPDNMLTEYVFGRHCQTIGYISINNMSLLSLSFKFIMCWPGWVTYLEAINIVDCDIGEMLPSELPFFKYLQDFTITRGKFLQVKTNHFKNSYTMGLHLTYTALSAIEKTSFANMKNLNEVNISHNNINELPMDLFQGTFYITVLDISYNKLITIPKELFKGFKILKELYLQKNSLKEISFQRPEKLFPIISVLNVYGNALTTIEMVKIEIYNLVLDNNQIRNLSDSAIYYPSLSMFSILNNPLVCDCHSLIYLIKYRDWALSSRPYKLFNVKKYEQAKCLLDTGYKFLKEIILENLCPIQNNCFYQQKALICENTSLADVQKYFKLQPKDIITMMLINVSVITLNGSDVFCKVESLSINQSKISTIPSNFFGCFKNISDLSLSLNHISEIKEGAFSVIDHLIHLNIDRNEIKEITQNYFGKNYDVKFINISKNSLTNIHNQSFINLNKLIVLDLSNNMLKSLAIRYPSSIKVLYLHNNLLLTLPAILSKIIYVTFFNNLLDCNSLAPFIKSSYIQNQSILTNITNLVTDYHILEVAQTSCQINCPNLNESKVLYVKSLKNLEMVNDSCKFLPSLPTNRDVYIINYTQINNNTRGGFTVINLFKWNGNGSRELYRKVVNDSYDTNIKKKDKHVDSNIIVLIISIIVSLGIFLFTVLLFYKYREKSRLAKRLKEDYLNYNTLYEYGPEQYNYNDAQDTQMSYDNEDNFKYSDKDLKYHSPSHKIEKRSSSISLSDENEDSYNRNRLSEIDPNTNGIDSVSPSYDSYNYDDLATSGYDMQMLRKDGSELDENEVRKPSKSFANYVIDDKSSDSKVNHFALYKDKMGEIFPKELKHWSIRDINEVELKSDNEDFGSGSGGLSH
ncbi:unnamed protein product [Gordionus sp. m RMFG-2023]|uniref:uncharacterized protein LOC135931265 n=1 Tax=Gordionus sp. m RMFG-2023 TaxID=3053472 RepID=UPI0030E2E2AF